jgi:hypothetical protein
MGLSDQRLGVRKPVNAQTIRSLSAFHKNQISDSISCPKRAFLDTHKLVAIVDAKLRLYQKNESLRVGSGRNRFASLTAEELMIYYFSVHGFKAVLAFGG